MSLLSLFPDPPGFDEVTLCEYNSKYVSENVETADVKKHVPATHVSEHVSSIKVKLFLDA